MNKFKQLWSNMRSSFWFMPSLIVVVSIAFAVALIETDSAGSDRWLVRWPRLFGAGAEGARGMLSTIAGSMMTVVGVTFSMTVVALALASSQYTSRMLHAFQTLAGLTASPHRRRALGEQVQWIAELAERTVESAHDRARIDTLLARVREALQAEPALCAGEEKAN